MIRKSAVKVYNYAKGYTFDKSIHAFRKGGDGVAMLPQRMIPKPAPLSDEQVAEKLRKAKIHFGNINRMFKKRIAKFRRKK